MNTTTGAASFSGWSPQEGGHPLWSEAAARFHLHSLFDWVDEGCWLRVTAGWSHQPDGRHERWVERHYRWPDHLEVLVEHSRLAVAQKKNVFLCPNPLKEPGSRTEHLFKRLRCIAFDIDDQHDEDALDRLREAGAVLVGSGTPGHVHSYVLLPTSVTMMQHGVLAQRMKLALGIDKVQGAVQVLRLAGTANFKPENGGTPVAILSGVKDGQVSPEALDALLEIGDETTGVSLAATRDRALSGIGRSRAGRYDPLGSKSQVSWITLCDWWTRGHDVDTAMALMLRVETDRDHWEYPQVEQIIRKHGRGDRLRDEITRVFARRAREATTSDVETRARRQAQGGWLG